MFELNKLFRQAGRIVISDFYNKSRNNSLLFVILFDAMCVYYCYVFADLLNNLESVANLHNVIIPTLKYFPII